mmetsp:Transcript_55651/g.134260  ORF Transcript_55651/g.134260 Transcript_55651/m.134260 type:complete len:203 (-) Transcript_55651:119-727(-)
MSSSGASSKATLEASSNHGHTISPRAAGFAGSRVGERRAGEGRRRAACTLGEETWPGNSVSSSTCRGPSTAICCSSTWASRVGEDDGSLKDPNLGMLPVEFLSLHSEPSENPEDPFRTGRLFSGSCSSCRACSEQKWLKLGVEVMHNSGASSATSFSCSSTATMWPCDSVGLTCAASSSLCSMVAAWHTGRGLGCASSGCSS